MQPTNGMSYLAEGVERLREVISKPFEFESNWLQLGVSIGAAIAPKDGSNLEGLMEHADKAMYSNKRERKRMDNLAR